MIYGVIMAGGKGERFWPLSSEACPKQLLSITDERNMLQVTIDRVSTIVSKEQTIVVAGETIKEKILATCRGLTEENILAEPLARNTCLAIGYAAIHLQKKDSQAVMVVLSADHLIEPVTRLIKVITAGTKIATEDHRLITIGIIPSRAETGYGYIELSEDQWEVDGVAVCKVSAFKEKPRPTVAQQYYHGGRHLWNSGMFIWTADAILDALSKYQPEMHELLKEYATAIGTANEKKALHKLYNEADAISIDYGVLEEADNVLTLKGDFVWDDVGSWLSLERFRHPDKENNVIVGQAVTQDTYETTIYNNQEGLIAALGVSDLVIVRNGDVVMVAHKTMVDSIKNLMEKMSQEDNLKKYL